MIQTFNNLYVFVKKNVFKVIPFFVFLYISNIGTFTYAMENSSTVKRAAFKNCNEISFYNKTYNDKLFFFCGPIMSLFYTFYTNSDFLNFGIGGRFKLLSLGKRLYCRFNESIKGKNDKLYIIPCAFFQLNFVVFDFYYFTCFLLNINIFEIIQLLYFDSFKKNDDKNILCKEQNKVKFCLIWDLLRPKFVFNLVALCGSIFS